jgi:hypothetical protein
MMRLIQSKGNIAIKGKYIRVPRATIIPRSYITDRTSSRLYMLRNFSIIKRIRKLENRTGLNTRKGAKRLPADTYNNAGKYVDLPSRLYEFIILLKISA